MLSASDLPACPACGTREARAVQHLAHEDDSDLTTLYACAGCGRDVTENWRAVQPEKKPKPRPLVGPNLAPPIEIPVLEPHSLGVAATLKIVPVVKS